MKTRNYIMVALCLAAGCWTSCTNEVEDLFDKTANERLEERLSGFNQLLVEAEYGWVMEYYPGGSNQGYGGLPITAVFSKDGFVTMSNASRPEKMARSMFRVGKDMGLTLNFDTYNEEFHVWSDPDLTSGEGEGKGYLGDYEFQVGDYSKESFELIGKKHRSIIRTYALKEPAKDYLAKAGKSLAEFEEIAGIRGIKGQIDGLEVTGYMLNKRRFLLETAEEDQVSVSFMFTDKGMKLYRPFTIGGKEVDDLDFDFEKKKFSSKDGKTQLTLDVDSLALPLRKLLGNYTFKAGSFTAQVKIEERGGNLVVTGLPFGLNLTYDQTLGALIFPVQKLKSNPDVFLAAWNTSIGSLTWNTSYSMRTQWNGKEDDFQLSLVDNTQGRWTSNGKTVKVNAFIVWSPGNGEYRGFGTSRFSEIVLIKNP